MKQSGTGKEFGPCEICKKVPENVYYAKYHKFGEVGHRDVFGCMRCVLDTLSKPLNSEVIAGKY